MKKNNFVIFSLLFTSIFIIASCGCNRNNDDPNDPSKGIYYTVTFYAERGYFSTKRETSKTLEVKVKKGETVDRPLDPIVDDGDYEFVDWCVDTGTTLAFNFTTPIEKDTDLYAKYDYIGDEPFYIQVNELTDVDTAEISFDTYDIESSRLDFDNIWYCIGDYDDVRYTSNWLHYEIGQTLNVPEFKKLYIRADQISWQYFKLDYDYENVTYNIGGNIMSLLRSLDFKTQAGFDAQDVFNGLFTSRGTYHNGDGLVDASNLKLPATILSNSCYRDMFYGCKKLESFPHAIAEGALVDYAPSCCYQMFYDCDNLPNIVPADFINANNVGDGAFYQMFYDCDSIEALNDGDAYLSIGSTDGEMGGNACENMFARCEGITKIENIDILLPSMNLNTNCYYGMFYYDTGIEEVTGYLPATTLADYCYSRMFQNTKIKKINNENDIGEFLPSEELAVGCYQSMFGTIHADDGRTLPIEDRCLTKITGQLPATTLANYCYSGMFTNCWDLKEVSYDLLPATTLAPSCYSSMFSGCRDLEKSPFLPYEFKEEDRTEWEKWTYCYSSMFSVTYSGSPTGDNSHLIEISVGFSNFPHINEGDQDQDYIFTYQWVQGVIPSSTDIRGTITFKWCGEAFGTDLTNIYQSSSTLKNDDIPHTPGTVWDIQALDVPPEL